MVCQLLKIIGKEVSLFCSTNSLRAILISEIPEISRNYPFVPLVTGKPPNIPLKGPIPDSPLFWGWAKQSVLLAAHYTCLLFKCACVRLCVSECLVVCVGLCVCVLHGGVTVFVVFVIATRCRRRFFFGCFLGVALVSFVGQNYVLIMPVLFSFCHRGCWPLVLEKWGAPAVGFFMPEWAISLAQRFRCLCI